MVLPQSNNQALQIVNKKKELPQAVKEFLATPVGRNFTAEQVLAAYNNASRIMKAESGNIVSETKIDEDFSKLTAGSEDAPDATNIAESMDNFTKQPGWGSFLTYQAGGKAFLGFDEVGDGGPGYLMSPALDLRDNDGVFKVTFRVKNANPNAQDQGLQYFIMNDDPDKNKKSIIQAATLPMTTEWKDLELVLDGGVQYTSVMFFGWQGKVLVDNLKIEKLTYPLSKPANLQFKATGGCRWGFAILRRANRQRLPGRNHYRQRERCSHGNRIGEYRKTIMHSKPFTQIYGMCNSHERQRQVVHGKEDPRAERSQD